MAKASAAGRKIIATNKNAARLYTMHEMLEAGLVLRGTEAKSVRDGLVQVRDAYAYISKGEAWVSNLNIAPCKYGTTENHEALRVRKLLLHRKEIEKIRLATEAKGRTIVVRCLYYMKNKVKVELAICTGKKLHDKRESSKKKDQEREMERAVRRSKD